jgi:hypothetical protein
MLSDRVRRRCVKLAAIDDADADMRFADIERFSASAFLMYSWISVAGR